MRSSRRIPLFFLLICAAVLLASPATLRAQEQKPNWSAQEKPIYDQIAGLRKLPDAQRAKVTRQVALDIRALPNTQNKVRLANGLASRATEGDFGRDTLQEVATTLADALQALPQPDVEDGPAPGYRELAELVRYEHMTTTLDAPQLKAAMAKLEADDAARQRADFTLTDLNGKTWTLSQLKGKVVLVNFWATWCPPCRKEMPDLQALYDRYKEQGFVILAISDETADKVTPFLKEHNISYPVMLDEGGKINKLFVVDGIPKSFVYNREGRLVAQSIDMRTRGQFEQMLGEAGLK